MPRTLMASMKLSWLLPDTPGENTTRSFTSLMLDALVNSPESAVMARGTSWADSSRLVAVTTISSMTVVCSAMAGADEARAVATAAAMGFSWKFGLRRPRRAGLGMWVSSLARMRPSYGSAADELFHAVQ